MFYKRRWFWAFVLPVLIVFTFVILVPSLMGIIGSFKNWHNGDTNLLGKNFNGLENYKSVFFKDESFWKAVLFTFEFAILTVILVNIIGFGLASMLTKAFRGRNFFRAGFFLPNLIGGLVLGYLWNMIFNNLFDSLGWKSWIGTTQTKALFALVIVVSWQMSGYVMIIYIAQIQNVRKDLIEAAKVSGGGRWTILKSVTIPQIMPAITVSLFLVLTRSFQTFDQNLSLTGGSAGSNMIAKDIYDTAFRLAPYNTGIAQAKAVIFTILVATLAIVQVKFTSKREVEA